MELYTLISLASAVIEKLGSGNPVYLDLLKLAAGSVLWIGGLMGFMYRRQLKLKAMVTAH